MKRKKDGGCLLKKLEVLTGTAWNWEALHVANAPVWKRKIIKSSKSFFVASGPIAEWVAMLTRVCVERVRLPYVRLCRDFVGNRQKAFKASETEKSANRVLKNASFDWLFVYPFSLWSSVLLQQRLISQKFLNQ